MASADYDFTIENAKFHEYVESTFNPELRTPVMLRGSFNDAINQTTGKMIPKPFFIYIHDTNASNHDEFFTQNICHDMVCEYLLNEDWPIWPVQVSDKVTIDALKSKVRNLVSNEIDVSLIVAPMMIMLIREQFKNRIAALMCNNDIMVIVDQLYDHGELYKCHIAMVKQIIQGKKDKMLFERQQKQLKVQQKKEENEERARLEEAEQVKAKEEQMKLSKEKERENVIQYAKSQIKDTLPSKNNFVCKFRCYNGVTLSREFSESQTINDVMYYLESHGYVRGEIKLLFSYPVKNLCDTVDMDTGLVNSGMSKREMINVQMK